MKDQRLKVFRSTLDGLTESLEAVVRVARWNEVDAPPEPLRVAIAKLGERLSSAGRLATGSFVGSPDDTNKVKAMCASMKQLDAAYVAYRRELEARPNQAAEAAGLLETDIAKATARARN